MTTDKNSNPLYYKVRLAKTLRGAWRKVYQNGIHSKSKENRDAIKSFSENTETALNRISSQLRHGTFRFLPATGVPKKRPSGSPRPIVVAPIENRIVQRAILDVLQVYPPIMPYFDVATSYGGLKNKGVPDAIAHAYRTIESAGSYFIRSDIQGFFTKIPKSNVLSTISNPINDQKIMAVLSDAIKTELENIEQLGNLADLFPLDDEGVAQGSSMTLPTH